MEHGGNLRAGRRTLWIKQIFGFSLYQSVADCPLHYCFCVIRNLVRVLEFIKISRNGQLVALVVRVAVEDGGKLFAGNGIVRAEFVLAVACKDAIRCRPCDCVGVPPSGFHIGKAVFALRRETALHAPENGCHHAACHRPVRTEQGLARAEHQTIFVNEHCIVVEPVLFRNISKGVYDYVRIFIRAPACVYGHIFRQRNLGNLICQALVAVPADKGMPMPSRNVFCQAEVGVVCFPHVGYSTAAIGFKVQRVIGDGRFAAAATAATAADIRPVGVDDGIFREFGSLRDLFAAVLIGKPAVEAVVASGDAGQRA